LFATLGLQFPIGLHATGCPAESFGHAIDALHVCVHTCSPAPLYRWQVADAHCALVVQLS
jgi:hypothetical protein